MSERAVPRAVQAIRASLGELPTSLVTGTLEECEHCKHAIAILPKQFGHHALAVAFAGAWSLSPLA